MDTRKYMVDIPEGESGEWRVKKYSVTPEEECYQSLRCLFNPQRPARVVPAGDYTMLSHNGVCVMSDTPDEIQDHIIPIMRAKGHCLVAGLGLGLVVSAMLDNPKVDKVTVLELSEDVIDLVGVHMDTIYGERLEIIHTDAMTWKPPKDAYYEVAWFDIWNHIDEENLSDMATIQRRYARKSEWKDCWQQNGCIAQRERIESGRGWY